MKKIIFTKNLNNEYRSYEGDADWSLNVLSLIFNETLGAQNVKIFLDNDVEFINSLSCNTFVIYKSNQNDVVIKDFYPKNIKHSMLVINKILLLDLVNKWFELSDQQCEKIVLYQDGNNFCLK